MPWVSWYSQIGSCRQPRAQQQQCRSLLRDSRNHKAYPQRPLFLKLLAHYHRLLSRLSAIKHLASPTAGRVCDQAVVRRAEAEKAADQRGSPLSPIWLQRCVSRTRTRRRQRYTPTFRDKRFKPVWHHELTQGRRHSKMQLPRRDRHRGPHRPSPKSLTSSRPKMERQRAIMGWESVALTIRGCVQSKATKTGRSRHMRPQNRQF